MSEGVQMVDTSHCRVAVLSSALPPAPSGQAHVLAHHLEEWNKEDCFLLSEDPAFLASVRNREAVGQYLPLPARRSHRHEKGLLRNLLRAFEILTLPTSLSKRVAGIADTLRPQKPDVLVVCSGSLDDLPSGLALSRALDIPFVAYLFDDPVLQWPDFFRRLLARFWEPWWSMGAAAVIVPNEILSEDFRLRTGVEPVPGAKPRRLRGLPRGRPPLAQGARRPDPDRLYRIGLPRPG